MNRLNITIIALAMALAGEAPGTSNLYKVGDTLYRIVVEGWSKEDAVREMTSEAFGFHRVRRAAGLARAAGS